MRKNVPRPAGELEQRLDQQIGFLERSAFLYDSGYWDEAARLATSIATLVHDGNGQALLSALGLRDRMLFSDTALHRSAIDERQQSLLAQARLETANERLELAGGRPEAGLAQPAFVGDVLAWVPRLEKAPENHDLSFDEWWTAQVVEASDGITHSRKQIVLTMRNQDGGAHVDVELERRYDALLRDDLGVQTVRPEDRGGDWTLANPPGGWISPEGNVTHATVRQVAHELLETLQQADLAP